MENPIEILERRRTQIKLERDHYILRYYEIKDLLERLRAIQEKPKADLLDNYLLRFIRTKCSELTCELLEIDQKILQLNLN